MIINRFSADSQVQPNFNTKGITMISMALLCDAVIGNVQEKSMKTFNAPNAEVVLFSYFIGFIYLFVVMLCTGDLTEGLQFFARVKLIQISLSFNNSVALILYCRIRRKRMVMR